LRSCIKSPALSRISTRFYSLYNRRPTVALQPVKQDELWKTAIRRSLTSATPPAMMFATTLPGCKTANSSWLILPIPDTCLSSTSAAMLPA
jgi:hypothetical protein